MRFQREAERFSKFPTNKIMNERIARLFFLLSVFDLFVMVYLVITGFPPEILGRTIRLKNMRTPFLLFLSFLLIGLVFHPERKMKISFWMKKIEAFTSRPYAIWILFGAYGILFLWQQITEYLFLEINFLPFSFYDYMLYYYFHGKIHFTGLLHGYYHVNNILFLLAPFWYFWKSPLLLVSIYGLIAAAAIFPLYGLAKERFRETVPPFCIAFVYLNYKYLQNVLLMNFSVEIFYPLFIFLVLYSALKKRWSIYYLSLLLGLTVKEDSFIYFSALGLLVFFMKERKHGLLTLLCSSLYFIFLLKIFTPWSGNNILQEDLNNFPVHGNSLKEIASNLFSEPVRIFTVLFGSPKKLETYFKLFSRLAFLPLCTPSVLLILAPLFPVFLHQTGRDTDFIELNFHYAAPVIPFVFIALIFGFSNLYHKAPVKMRKAFLWLTCLVLVFLNGGHYVTRKITRENLKSIAWARSIPLEANLVTHGHLLPYFGYRKYNYYFAEPYELEKHPMHEPFTNADYYFIDLNVPLYPMDRTYFERKIGELKTRLDYKLIRSQGERYLFKRKTSLE